MYVFVYSHQQNLYISFIDFPLCFIVHVRLNLMLHVRSPQWHAAASYSQYILEYYVKIGGVNVTGAGYIQLTIVSPFCIGAVSSDVSQPVISSCDSLHFYFCHNYKYTCGKTSYFSFCVCHMCAHMSSELYLLIVTCMFVMKCEERLHQICLYLDYHYCFVCDIVDGWQPCPIQPARELACIVGQQRLWESVLPQPHFGKQINCCSCCCCCCYIS